MAPITALHRNPLFAVRLAVGSERTTRAEVSAAFSTGLDSFAPALPRPDFGWMTRPPAAPPVNRSAEFGALYARAESGTPSLPPEASNYTYLSVPGLFNDRAIGYLSPNERALRDAGLEVRHVPVDGDSSIEANAEVVRAAILEASRDGRQVVLLGHSKGGVEIAAALALHPELAEHVRAVVAMQSPFGGSAIADDIMGVPYLKRASDEIVRAFGGDPAAALNLTHASMKAYWAAHPYPAGVPTVTMASNASNVFAPTAIPGAYLRQRYGVANDGFVAVKDALLPGADAVIVPGIDHASFVLGAPSIVTSVDPGAATLALVGLALQRSAR